MAKRRPAKQPPPAAAPAPRKFIAEAHEDATLCEWKAKSMVAALATIDVDAARAEARALFDVHDAQVVECSLGTLALRAGQKRVDWEALCRSLASAKRIEKALPTFTTVGEPSLAALPGWSAEAKATRAAYLAAGADREVPIILPDDTFVETPKARRDAALKIVAGAQS